MNDAEDLCGCLACAALCGICCVAAAEEDKRERERAVLSADQQLKTPMIQVQPIAVASPRSQKTFQQEEATRAEKKRTRQAAKQTDATRPPFF
ncbi:hypothetical protein ATCC90586_007101 [Pythium insidiosum]|nr:hypothetical protein ATCC90586_007101 [Pythium insidiosum]